MNAMMWVRTMRAVLVFVLAGSIARNVSMILRHPESLN